MNANRLQFAAMIFIIGTMLACIGSGRWLLNGEMNIFNSLASFNAIQLNASGLIGFPKYLIGWFSGVITALSWNYPFLSSPWAIPLKVIGWVCSYGAIVEMIQFAQYTVASVVSWFKP